jgi:hypothetical protein
MNDLFNGDSRVYSLSQPYAGYSYVMVQAMTDDTGQKSTCIFGCDNTGNPKDWEWLEGSFVGGLSHEQALKGAGYNTIP